MKTLIAGVMGGLLVAGAALAQNSPATTATTAPAASEGVPKDIYLQRSAKRFARLDSNGDGTISKVELDQSIAEIQARTTRRMQRLFDREDRNGDGVVSREEFDQYAMRRFEALDRDGDGRIMRSERRGRAGGGDAKPSVQP